MGVWTIHLKRFWSLGQCLLNWRQTDKTAAGWTVGSKISVTTFSISCLCCLISGLETREQHLLLCNKNICMQNFCHKGSSEQLIIVVDCFYTGKPVCCKFFIAFLLKHQQKTAEYFLLITKMTVDLTVIKAACALSKPLPQQVIFYTAFLNRKEHAKVVI